MISRLKNYENCANKKSYCWIHIILVWKRYVYAFKNASIELLILYYSLLNGSGFHKPHERLTMSFIKKDSIQ